MAAAKSCTGMEVAMGWKSFIRVAAVVSLAGGCVAPVGDPSLEDKGAGGGVEATVAMACWTVDGDPSDWTAMSELFCRTAYDGAVRPRIFVTTAHFLSTGERLEKVIHDGGRIGSFLAPEGERIFRWYPGEVDNRPQQTYPMEVTVDFETELDLPDAIVNATRVMLRWRFTIEQAGQATAESPITMALPFEYWDVEIGDALQRYRYFVGNLRGYGVPSSEAVTFLDRREREEFSEYTPRGVSLTISPGQPPEHLALMVPRGASQIELTGRLTSSSDGLEDVAVPVTITGPGSYYVDDTGFHAGVPAAADAPAEDGPTELPVVEEPPADEPASAPGCDAADDNDVSRATEIRTTSEGRLCADDRDWYYMPLDGFHAIEVTFRSGTGPGAVVLSHDGESVDAEQAGYESELRVEGTGPFWVLVAGNPRTDARDYTITVW
jgi:hypothetical protein